jgi:acetyl esterase/lipase
MPEFHEVVTKPEVEYAVHDGVRLIGDLYLPQGATGAPVMVAVHGGGWQQGDRFHYRYWGPYLARAGIALFSIEYRLSAPRKPSFPQAFHDVRAAVQFVGAKAAEFGLDASRIGLMGDSAGGHLACLVALAGDLPDFKDAYREDAQAGRSTAVKAVVSIYGVYDLTAQWNGDLKSRPRDSIVEKFIGRSPIDDRRIFFDASPLSYATARGNAPAFLLAWGTADDIVEPSTQAEPFRDALKQAGFYVRTTVLTDAPHFWCGDPIDEPNSYTGFLAPRMLRFLQLKL